MSLVSLQCRAEERTQLSSHGMCRGEGGILSADAASQSVIPDLPGKKLDSCNEIHRMEFGSKELTDNYSIIEDLVGHKQHNCCWDALALALLGIKMKLSVSFIAGLCIERGCLTIIRRIEY